MLKLNSDFVDYYDYEFDGSSSLIFNRLSDDRTFSRIDMFIKLEEMGYNVPPYCFGIDFIHSNFFRKDQGADFIVHENLYSCRGESKKFVSYYEVRLAYVENRVYKEKTGKELFNKYDDYLLVKYIDSPKGVSLRKLFIGNKFYILRYTNPGGWMSNNTSQNKDNPIQIEIIGEGLNTRHEVMRNYPLYAIDFVGSGTFILEDLYAIDLNIAPGIKGSGIEQLLKPSKVVELIEDFIKGV